MKISRNTINLKPPHHPTSFIRIEVSMYSSFFLISVFSLVEHITLWDIVLSDSIPDIHFMNFEDILHIKTEHRTRVFREADININSKFLI